MLRLSLALSLSLLSATAGAADRSTLAMQAVRGDAKAIQALRAMGQPGVDALMAIRESVDRRQFEKTIDAVCRQHDCAWSGLYWYTDLAAAKREAQRTNRPILTLRLLGNLDEELSCANSRYFRTLLYSNSDIRSYLRSHYVLHWQSERAAPVITIDFGDGRRMQRTVTGNSIHYVLDSTGRPLDAIPGLYQPPAFLALLREGAALHETLRELQHRNESRDEALRRYHANAIFAMRRSSPRLSLFSPANDYLRTRSKRVTAWLSAAPAPTKEGGELPVLEKISFDARAYAVVADLTKKAERMVRGPRTIDANARALIQTKRAASPDPAMRSAASLDAVLAKLEQTLEADTRLNEDKFHQEIHRWFVYDDVATVDALNARAYNEIFLAPRSDPWMGLVSGNSFTGITGEGLHVSR